MLLFARFFTDSLYFVVDIHELGGNLELVFDFRSQRPDAENLGAVVPGRNQVEPEFFHGDGYGLLDFAGDKHVTTERDGFLDAACAGAAADGDLPDSLATVQEAVLHPVLENSAGKVHKALARNRLGKLPNDSHGTFALAHEPFKLLEAERTGNLHVVAYFHVAVERQVVAVKRDAVLHQAAHALAELAHEHAVLTLPKAIRVVDDNAIRMLLDCRIDKPVTEGYSRHDFGHLVGRLHAEAIHTVVLERMRFKKVVQPAGKIRYVHTQKIAKKIPTQGGYDMSIAVMASYTAGMEAEGLSNLMRFCRFMHRINF